MNRHQLIAIRCAVAGLLCITSPASADTIISTTGGGIAISPFGKPDAQTFGQTFTTPSDNALQSFTFYLSPAPSLTFRAYVFAWDPGALRATGSALFTSSLIVGPGPLGSGFSAVPVNVGSLVLNSGGMYVAFFSSSAQPTFGEIALQSSWDSPAANQYAGGAFVYLNNGENVGAFTTQTWSTNRQGAGSDVRFAMAFTATPEPSALVLVATSTFAIGGFALARRRRQTRRSTIKPMTCSVRPHRG
jgi:hypothetical protein